MQICNLYKFNLWGMGHKRKTSINFSNSFYLRNSEMPGCTTIHVGKLP